MLKILLFGLIVDPHRFYLVLTIIRRGRDRMLVGTCAISAYNH